MSQLKFNFAIVSPMQELIATYTRELTKSPSTGTIDSLDAYPGNEALTRMLRLNAVDLFLIDCTELESALDVSARIRSEGHADIVALCNEDVKALAALMRAGIRDYIPLNASADAIRAGLAGVIEKLRDKPRPTRVGGEVVTFLPGKPGTGASTVAAHTAFLAASGAAGRRVLLMDFDRESPVQAFLHRLHPEHFLQEALANSHQMDSGIWSRLISQRGPLDILPADGDGLGGIEGDRVQQLLEFLRRAYDLTCIDLPGPLDNVSAEALMESKRVFLVCTQELASVHITLRKAERLRRLGLSKELRLVLNRYERGHVITKERISELTGLPVEVTIPNSYALANASAERGAAVDPATSLGKGYTKLAQLLLSDRIEIPRKPRRFLEFLYQPFLREGATA